MPFTKAPDGTLITSADYFKKPKKEKKTDKKKVEPKSKKK